MTNPLLSDWDTPYELPPFDLISDADFAPAFEQSLAEARSNLKTIAENSDAPTFENTIGALECADHALGRVLSVFYSLAGADSNETRQALQRDFAPELAAYSSELTMNPDIFARIETLWQSRDTLGLTDEQSRLLMLYRRNFVRSGAALQEADSNRLKEVTKRLAVLGTEFTQNLLADERDWSMVVDDLTGLPDFLVDAMQAAGAERGATRPVVTLSRSLIVPFLQFSPNRNLREKAYKAWAARGANGGDTDNREICAETLSLREERAKLLGYDTFSAYKLETEMAKSPKAVQNLLMSVWQPAKAQAERDATILSDRMQTDGINGPLKPWDWYYYSGKRREEEHDLDEAELKPYFQLDRMIEAATTCAGRLFDLTFVEVDAPKYHPDVRIWEVSRNGKLMAVFVADYFARGSKRSGAWCSAMRQQKKLGGDVRPIVVNVCNFAKPPNGQAALLSYDDARTLFHEFGHALHHMLSDVTYESISGTSVARDFVELPSQLYEHWLEVPEVLAEFATHADTDEPMPREMLDRLLAAQTYDMGHQTVEYVASALVDLAFHNGPSPRDAMAKQAEVLAEIGMPEAIEMRHRTPQFAHVFAGDGYSSGYYSYMWSEVMDADAFAAFEEADGPFDPVMAAKLEHNILSKGGSVDADDLYAKFRGRMPGIDALLRGRGLDNVA